MPGRSGLRLTTPAVVAVIAAVMPAVVMGASQGIFGRVGYDKSLPGVSAALAIGRAVPETGVIAAPPEIYWLRLVSRRAVVADCKAGPYGGKAWLEYMSRLDALGGCAGPSSHFSGLTPDQIEALSPRYGVTNVLLYGNDPKMAYARTHWHVVYETPPQDFLYMQHGWTLFQITPS